MRDACGPVGNLRWRPPAPVEKWQGTLDATTYGNTCPQVTELGAFAGPSSTTEDCLYLNVFTTGNTEKRKPVIVWIHGGGNVDGESNDYDGSKLANGGPLGEDTVIVTMNYRMGLFGFVSHPALNAEGHLWGNYGVLDQLAVLHWVQRNIAAFGGDPSNVTLGGQSAGASDTTSALLSPLAMGLFHRAILESSPRVSKETADAALAAGVAFGKTASCAGTDAAAAACLRQLSAPSRCAGRAGGSQWRHLRCRRVTLVARWRDGRNIPEAADRTPSARSGAAAARYRHAIGGLSVRLLVGQSVRNPTDSAEFLAH